MQQALDNFLTATVSAVLLLQNTITTKRQQVKE